MNNYAVTRTCALILAVFTLFTSEVIGQDINKAKANPKRGFYSSPITVSLASSTAGASIRYTTDGSKPNRGYGQSYGGPFSVSRTTVVRAVAYVGSEESKVSASTYIFTSDVRNQPWVLSGHPNWNINFGGATHQLDYQMDPNIVNNGSYNLDQSLKAIPTISISLPKDKIFGEANGIYRKGGSGNNTNYEEEVSIEFINAQDPNKNYQTNAGLTPHSHVTLKRSLRLYFRGQYGDSKLDYDLFEEAPEGSESAGKDFDKLVLRAGLNRGFAGYMPEKQNRTVLVRDEWGRQSQIAMSGMGVHGTFAHLYLNGIYWGIYNVAERPDEDFTSEYLGGEPEDYFAGNHGGALGGNNARFATLVNTLIHRDQSILSNYNELKEYLDVEQFIDYVLLYFYAGAGDWQDENPDGTGGYENNFYHGNRNNPPGPTQYFVWDFESSWFDSQDMQWTGRSNDGAWIKPQFLTSSEGSIRPFNSARHKRIAAVFRSAWRSSEFRSTWRDRVYTHIRQPGGALTDQESKNRFRSLSDYIETAVVAEFARWGDSRMPDSFTGVSSQFDRNTHWYSARDEVLGMMNGNGEALISILQSTKMSGSWMYTSTRAPAFSRESGEVTSGYNLSISNPNGGDGDIYYTTNGSDPRLVGGGVSGAAMPGGDAIQVRVDGGVTNINARVYNSGGWWSPLHKATYYGPQDLQKVVINEIMYNPTPTGTSGQPDHVDGDEYEFLELYNNSPGALNLSNATFTDGIEFTFPDGTILAPNQFYILASNSLRFQQRYSRSPDGVYSGRLKDGGENLTLSEATGALIDNVNYDDAAPWPTAADGTGRSLELTEPGASNNGPSNWLISAVMQGTPGVQNTTGLPVEMSSMDAFVDGRSVEIHWSTSSEENNAGFAIEHAEIIGLNARETSPFPVAFAAESFLPKKEFKEIGYVEGNGTTTESQNYSYTAGELAVGMHYFRLRQIDFDGRQTYTDELALSVGTPTKYLLDSAYPNPFNPTTTIRFAVLERSPVEVKLYDMVGREVQTLFSGIAEDNVMQIVRIDGSDLSSGIYFVQMTAPEFIQTKEIVLAK